MANNFAVLQNVSKQSTEMLNNARKGESNAQEEFKHLSEVLQLNIDILNENISLLVKKVYDFNDLYNKEYAKKFPNVSDLKSRIIKKVQCGIVDDK